MEKHSIRICRAVVQLLAAMSLAACASATAVPVSFDSPVEGFRIYDVKPILVVNGQSTSIELVPNYNKAYAVQFRTFLASQEYNLDVTRGMLQKVNGKQDSTAIIAVLQEALKQFGPALTGKAMSGTVDGGVENRFQVYEFVFSDDGSLVGLRPLINQRDLQYVRTTKVGGGTTTPRVVPQTGEGGTTPTPGTVN